MRGHSLTGGVPAEFSALGDSDLDSGVRESGRIGASLSRLRGAARRAMLDNSAEKAAALMCRGHGSVRAVVSVLLFPEGRTMPDVYVENHGSLFLFHMETKEAKEWVRENVGEIELPLAVEHRYAYDLAQGMLDAGLTLE